jgi:hypothetical protein
MRRPKVYEHEIKQALSYRQQLREAALEYYRKGYKVAPCYVHSKKIASTYFQDEHDIRRLWRDGSWNIAISTEGLAVVGTNDFLLAARVKKICCISLIPGGGYHLYFSKPECEGEKYKQLIGEYIYNDNRYVIAPPSELDYPDKYQWFGNGLCEKAVLTPLPTWLIEALWNEREHRLKMHHEKRMEYAYKNRSMI